MQTTAWQIAVVGAGPVGLALALQAARELPHTHLTVFDARPADRDLSVDPRTLALSLGSVQALQRLHAWPTAAAARIAQVHVSQQAPTLLGLGSQPEVLLTAERLGVPMLGAVLAYGSLLQALQDAWLAAVAAEPLRLHSRFGTPVVGVKNLADGVEVDAGIAERFDLAVVAEGGIYSDQVSKAFTRDYGQTAWVGNVALEGGTPGRAFERFTPQGPAALLPLPPSADQTQRAALVWCVKSDDDPVRDLSDAQRLAVLNTLFPRSAGRVSMVSALHGLPLGLNAERSLLRGRTVRIGNAAQTLHPVAGQGLNLGLRDAHSLVAALRACSHTQGDIDSALRRAQWQHAPDRWATLATTDLLARSFTWQLPGAASLRGLGLAALQAAPPLQRWLARQMMFGLR